MIALYAASLAPFAALKRPVPFDSPGKLMAAIDACDTMAGATLLVRSWPLALGAMQAASPGGASPFTALSDAFRSLRNVVLALRDVTQAGPRGALTATFDAGARQALETLLSTSGARGAVTSVGKRSPTVYPLTLPGLPRPLAAAIETLAGGRIAFTLADSDESLTWAFRAAELPSSEPAADPPEGKPPILRVAADLAALPKLGPLLNAGRDEQQLLELLAHLRHVDGDIVTDGDLLRLTLRSPLKQ